MKVRLLTSYASPEASYSPGEVVDLPDDEAERFLENGLCEVAVVQAKAERATIERKPRVKKKGARK